MFIAGGRHCHAGTPYTRGWELLAGLWAKMAESVILFALMKLRKWARKQGMMGTHRGRSFCACLQGVGRLWRLCNARCPSIPLRARPKLCGPRGVG